MNRPWDQLAAVFERAADLAPDERAPFLDEACEGDDELRAEVEAMLAGDDGSDFLQHPQTAAGSFEDRVFESLTGTQIGAYELQRVVAVGGMGTVYEARQQSPQRRVALKILRLGSQDPMALRRFQYESEVLARLQHPGIAQVYEAGVHRDGSTRIPFFAMEFVEGARTIVAWKQEERPSLESLIESFATVCDAVQHGHQRGVIHRDLKPANILVDGAGRPKVIDFGIARATEVEAGATMTRTGEILGTLNYMSPEQLAGDSRDLDLRSDVYSLGVVLYELCCGQAPYDLRDQVLTEVARIVCVEPPIPPRTASSDVPEELGWVLLRALEKEPDRRYASAGELAADLRRFLSEEPVVAGPPSRTYRLRKLVRRYRLLALSLAAVVLALLVGGIAATWGLVEARRERGVAEREAIKAKRVSEFFAGMLNRANPFGENPEDMPGPEVLLVDVLDRAAREIDESFAAEADVASTLRRAIGESYQGLGRFEESARQLELALAEAIRHGGEDSLQSHGIRASLAVTHLQRRLLDDAERLALEARAGFERHLGAESFEVLNAASQLAGIYRMQGRLEEAESVLAEAISRAETSDSVEPYELWSARSQLAYVVSEAGRHEEAERLLRDVIDWYEENGWHENVNYHSSLGNLAAVLEELGRADEALAFCEKTLDLRTQYLGPENAWTLLAVHNLASEYSRRSRFDDARPMLERVIAWRESHLGPNHERTVKSMNQLAVLFFRQGESEAAERQLRAVVERARDSEGSTDVLPLYLCSHGSALGQLGRLDEAEERLAEGVGMLRAARPEDDAMRQGAERKLAEIRDRIRSAGGDGEGG